MSSTALRRVFVIINAHSGCGNDAALAQRVRGLFTTAGVEAEVHLAHGGNAIAAIIADAITRRVDAVIAAGGDGTVSAVAGALAGGQIALGVLPLGTLNHFARDLGLPMDLEAAVRQIAAGLTMRVDVGEVNGRVFVNNSSLGLYPDIVHDREQQQRRFGRSKWLALFWATIAALRKYPFMDVCIFLQGERHLRRTPFVFIGNNEYQMEGLALGERRRLNGGHLSLYAAQRPGRLRLIQLALRALTGRLKSARDFDLMRATAIVVESHHHHLRVAIDGEIMIMKPPLHYRIRPSDLNVLCVPPGGAPNA
jgi:YegS/Rv2252/BmrU family lipid kinase